MMTIGHASGIARANGWQGVAWITPALAALFNMVGAFAGGWLADRIAPLKLLTALPVISAAALLVILGTQSGGSALIGLSFVGFTYGAIIAVFPSTLAKVFGTAAGARVYGKVFTAWGSAGLLAPWLAGHLYDRSNRYSTALSVAVALSLVAAVTAHVLSTRFARRALLR